MRLLSYDPGGERYGWSVLDAEPPASPTYIASGIWGTKRRKDGKKFSEPYQEYKLRLIRDVTHQTTQLITSYDPDEIVLETLPVNAAAHPQGGAQRILGQVMVACVATVAELHAVPVAQVAANTIKARIGGHKSATKVKVRNGVTELLPVLRPRASEWTKVFDESDGIATGLAYFGYKSSL